MRQTEGKLRERSELSLKFLLRDGSESTDAVTVFRTLGSLDGDGDLPVELDEAFQSRSPLIVGVFDRSRRIFAQVGADALSKEQLEIQRLLKSIAVELMTEGADVRGLISDAVPLVAYSLFHGSLPVSPDAGSPATVEQINNLLLGIADDLSIAPTDERPLISTCSGLPFCSAKLRHMPTRCL